MKPELVIRLQKGTEKTIQNGYPWIHRGEYVEASDQQLVPPGSLAEVRSSKNVFLGIGTFNPHATIACRMLTQKTETIDAAFLQNRLRSAAEKRESWCSVPYYRMVHSEGDFLPGLLIDRFDDIFVIQSGTAGMDLLLPQIKQLLVSDFGAKTIVLRNDASARAVEKIKQYTEVVVGALPELVEVHENGVCYLADLLQGQKTGWFFDQRDNRALIANLAPDKTLIDIYSHSGGFGLLAAKANAKVILVDSSASALAMATQAASRNNFSIDTKQGDAFAVMNELAGEGAYYDIVLADPPAFIKQRKDVVTGLKGYEKVARMAAMLVKQNGLFMISSCSHHATRPRFLEAVRAGMKKAGREGELLSFTGAAKDHPAHPLLPQNEYLKAALFRLA